MKQRSISKRIPWPGLRPDAFHFLLLACVLVALAASPAFGQTPGQEKVTRTFSFESPVFGETTVHGTTYTTVDMKGSLVLGRNAGDPALPVRFVQMLLPPGKSVADVSVTGLSRKVPDADVDLVSKPLFPFQASVPFGTPAPTTLTVNQGVYEADSLFPAESFHNCKVGHCRGYTIFSVGLCPLRYSPVRGEISWFSEMTITIELKDEGDVNRFFRKGNKADETWVKNLVCNPNAVAAYDAMPPKRATYPGGLCDPIDDYDFVIITTTQNGLDSWNTSGTIPYNWDSLMNKHTLVDGLACTIVTVQDIYAEAIYGSQPAPYNDNQGKIREFCRDAYEDWGTSYILVGADAEWIRARLMTSDAEPNVDADIYWNHLDSTFNDNKNGSWGEENDTGFDLYAEMFIGRLTADTPQDVSNWMKKSFYYADNADRDYLENAAFYGGDTGWNCQGDDFEDYSAIYGLDHWLGPNPGADPYPPWLGFQYGFDTWNQQNVGAEYDMTVMWTAEPPNPGGWMGGSSSSAITGLRDAISNDAVTLLSGIAHANYNMSLDVSYTSWENSYHNTKPFFIHDYGCHCGDMDAGDDGVLHSMLFHSDTELAFACVYNTGYGWGNFDCTCSSSALQQKSFWDYMFDVANNSGSTDNWQLGKAMAYARDLMAPTIDYSGGSWRETIQCCLLFGDPAQTIKPPAVPALFLTFPAGLPEGRQDPGLAYTISVEIKDGLEAYVPGTGYMHYRFDSASSYTDVPLTALGGGLFEATLPNTSPGDEPEFYFSAQGSGSSTIYSPWNAPATVYSFDIYFVEELWHDDFETNTGWTVQDFNLTTGTWERAVPNTTSGGQVAPTVDNPAGSGTYCFVTENGPAGGSYSDYDIDGGPTVLTSPVIDLSSGDAMIDCYMWYYSRDGDDPFKVEVSNNGGTSWTQVYSTNSSLSGWSNFSFVVGDYVTPTANVKVRFSAQDQPNNDIVEGGLDDFRVQRLNYNPPLWAEAYSFSAPGGCYIPLHIDATSAYAGRNYIVGASFSGTSPGTPLPGGKILPLNWDWLTDFVFNNPSSPIFQDFRGALDGQGTATAALNVAGPGATAFIGQTMNIALTLVPGFDVVSNAISIDIEP
jgi:hypothetical protein